MKTCPWCGRKSEDAHQICVECGREFQEEDGKLLFVSGPGPELPYPLRRCVIALFSILAYYVFLAFAWGASARYAFRVGLPNLGLPISVAFGILQSIAAFLIIPASFYFMAFLPLVLKQDDSIARKRWWKTAIVRSLFFAFVTPFFLFMLYSLVSWLLS
jgi:hypothetical protein